MGRATREQRHTGLHHSSGRDQTLYFQEIRLEKKQGKKEGSESMEFFRQHAVMVRVPNRVEHALHALPKSGTQNWGKKKETKRQRAYGSNFLGRNGKSVSKKGSATSVRTSLGSKLLRLRSEQTGGRLD